MKPASMHEKVWQAYVDTNTAPVLKVEYYAAYRGAGRWALMALFYVEGFRSLGTALTIEDDLGPFAVEQRLKERGVVPPFYIK